MDKKNQMPDFDKLTDRVINEPPTSPMFVMKTNLDSEDVSEDNPYFEGKVKNEQALENYFEQD
ncbi:hypothetical protein [Halalkalibacter urbisdiaboli]|uniref:hypothetical protein n=1 Tax=Halalkalibacter urbisdiaboli TaxID=1960589 RepID=UPI000B451A5F|nr:hypothetical protein [Halalkalibacter urbisdiaboli]